MMSLVIHLRIDIGSGLNSTHVVSVTHVRYRKLPAICAQSEEYHMSQYWLPVIGVNRRLR